MALIRSGPIFSSITLKGLSLGLGLLLLLPVVSIYLSFTTFELSQWQHLIQFTLFEYVTNSALLVMGVGAGTVILGVSAAWFVTQYDFWSKSVLEWLLLFPLAMPAYIIAYTYTGMFDSLGVDIRHLSGAIVLMSLVLYPYVYMLAKTSFTQQRSRYHEVAQSLGATEIDYFRTLALPLARPAIATGAALAMMEALADYGTVAYFGVSTLTTGIFRTWFGMGESNLASQLAACLATVVLVLLWLEQYSRRQMRFYGEASAPKSRANSTQRAPFSIKATAMALYLWALCISGFLLPALQLGWWSIDNLALTDFSEYWTLISNTLTIALVTACVLLLLALLFCYAQRLYAHSRAVTVISLTVNLGYAIPGLVIAVGLMQPLGWLDITLNQWYFQYSGEYWGLIFSGTLFALIFAYCVRFISVACHSINARLVQIKPNMDEAVIALGRSRWTGFRRVHARLLLPGLLTAVVLIVVDVLKELPATLVLRPFNFNTLAVKAFEYASDEQLGMAALPSLTIIVVGMLPIIILTRAMRT